ncbi:hypothetical protein [Nocardiopsis sp. B62]|uniref:hypothetical protein n=1 Tax=Nocardiopsis sp. B62 TaxID=2824874 RepID=UPI001B3778FC|nr:hypothetical protein [Nocardiopsis sp. B62]MBQ1082273.1 hypothetical protein [Nocardiopsis sp. B62]
MSGYHGTVGAIGVRPTVCPEPLRRALTLAGLLTGVLFTVWLVSAAPAHSSELPGADNPLTAGVVGSSSGLVAGTETLGGSLSGAVTTVSERATQHATEAVNGASEAARAVETEASAPVQQVRDVVRETSLPRPDHLSELVATDPAQDTEPAPGTEDDAPSADDRQDRETEAKAPEEHRAVAERPAAEALAAAQELGSVEYRAKGTTERDRATDSAPRSTEALTTIAGGSAPASGGTPSAPAVAGFLPVTGAPAPAPGLFQAARHVLRSAPADSADEPTFSPD